MNAASGGFKRIAILFSLTLILWGSAHGAPEPGRGFFDKGMFDFEAGLYDEAIISFDKALNSAPDNSLYRHYLGKAYAGRGIPAKAEVHLQRAYAIDPGRPGLRYDLGLVLFQLKKYEEAANMFQQAAAAEPDNGLAAYYTGLSLFRLEKHNRALPFFVKAGEKDSSLRVNASYYAGVCHVRGGEESRAVEVFEYVRSNAESAQLRSDATQWLERLRGGERKSRPYSLYLKAGVQYDDFVRLDPLEEDLYTGAPYNVDKTEEDLVYMGFFSGRYNVLNGERLVMGGALSHYQTWHQDLTRYDLAGSVGNIFAFYRVAPLTFGVSYIPSFYLMDKDSYLRRHLLRPEIIWRIGADVTARLTCHYYTSHYFSEAYKNGYANEILPSIGYRLPSNMGHVSLGMGYEWNKAAHPDEEYGQWTVRLESFLNMPLSIQLGLIVTYLEKEYDNTNSYYKAVREDARYAGTISLTRALYRDVIHVQGEFNYTENDSRIHSYDYRRTTSTIALVVTY